MRLVEGMDKHSEHRTIEHAIRGNGWATERLWRTHRRWVAAVVLAHKPNEADPDDLLQEVAAALVRSLPSLRDPSRFRPWLASLARNVARSSGRRVAVQRRRLVTLDDAQCLADPRAARMDERLAARQQADRLAEAMQTLTAEQRECLLLRGVQGLTQAEIAARLDVPVTTVETRVARARRRLRSALADLEQPMDRRRRA